MSSTTAHEPPARDWLLGFGMAVVVAAAAVASFAALRDLAMITGWHPRLAPLLPLCVDAYAMVATRVWLAKSTRNERARRWAKWNAIGAIACSVAGNAVDHALRGGALWPLAVTVSAVPPIVLGLLVHLAHLRGLAGAPATDIAKAESAVAEPAMLPAVSAPDVPSAPATAPKSAPAPRRAPKPRPAPAVSAPERAKRVGPHEPAMRALWDRERAVGRTPTGADLNRAAGLDPDASTGRKARRRWLAENPVVAVPALPPVPADPAPVPTETDRPALPVPVLLPEATTEEVA
ncbi:hypothetical protein GCM10023205_52600 [Yinghuangia aomiensis]|uniref:DUF2637 domain-containing protein n=1 Tax=Yinghuangia aomiensis TaxID=676205 RepID=A0ABP9HTM0_9ACTN